ncbi:MAG: hypothetical protein JWQ63_1335 [Mucilaginibacter sp.]|nr:hypothetical protein [Mucilaginibacter sp.]
MSTFHRNFNETTYYKDETKDSRIKPQLNYNGFNKLVLVNRLVFMSFFNR